METMTMATGVATEQLTPAQDKALRIRAAAGLISVALESIARDTGLDLMGIGAARVLLVEPGVFAAIVDGGTASEPRVSDESACVTVGDVLVVCKVSAARVDWRAAIGLPPA